MSFPLSHKHPYFIPIKSEESMAICAGIVFVDIAKPSFDKRSLFYFTGHSPPSILGSPSKNSNQKLETQPSRNAAYCLFSLACSATFLF